LGTLTVTNSTISDNTAFGGGGILNVGTLTVTNSTISDNTASHTGGGIYNNFGTLTVTNSTFSDNTAFTGDGGGIENHGTLTVTNSTIAGNTASFIGGGILNFTGTLTVTNSTISDNTASDGGGIMNTGFRDSAGYMALENSTISDNSARRGSGVSNGFRGTLTVKNSILANSSSGGNCSAASGTFTALGVNLADDGLCPGFDEFGSTEINLGPLADNGGPTFTHALRLGSVAINAATDCTLVDGETPVSTDQRGVTRPQGPACDVGAFELEKMEDGVVERACPFDAQAGRIVVEFPEDVVLTTRKQSDNSFGPLKVNIPTGTYNITLVSFDDHIEQPKEEDQTQESWFLQAENEQGDIVFESTPISDLPKAQNLLEERVEEHVEITQDITGLSARHVVDVGESETAESIWPVCAAFDALTAVQQAKLTAEDAAAGDFLGNSVSQGGDTALVGAYSDADAGENSGSAYVFLRDGAGNWSQQAELTAEDAAASDAFGYSVSLSGDTALVGAPGDDDAGELSGSAYVFVRDGAGNWSQQAKLTAADAAAGDFGHSVSLSGDTALVGARFDDDTVERSGSAYVFLRDGAGNWSQQAKLTAADASRSDFFGDSVSLSGDTALVGALGADEGAAYVFLRDGAGNWSQQAKLTAADAAADDFFGESVSLNGDTALVGALGAGAGEGSGAAYVFLRDGAGNWSQQAKLTAAEPAEFDRFGDSVSLSGDTALVGASEDNGASITEGAAYVFTLEERR
jgi:hypothetical protein